MRFDMLPAALTAVRYLTQCLLLSLTTLGAAQAGYPEKAITIVVPYTAGGSSDTLARLVASKLSTQIGKPVLVLNQAGANGAIASEFVSKAAPDGYTLMLGTISTHAVHPLLYKSSLDVFKDFTPVTRVANVYNVIVVHPSLPVRSLGDLIAYAKENPGKLTYGSSGNGTMQHLFGELFTRLTGTTMLHVPYKGGTGARNDLLAGHLSLMFSDVGALPFVQTGRLRALAVTGPKREPSAPEIPTAVEAGLPGFSADGWYGLFAPARTPQTVVDALNLNLDKVFSNTELRDALTAMGVHPVIRTSGTDLKETMLKDYKKWGSVIKAADIKID